MTYPTIALFSRLASASNVRSADRFVGGSRLKTISTILNPELMRVN